MSKTREIPAIIRRADLLVLPYRDGEQSGVLYTGLAFEKPMVLSNVGGFGEVAREPTPRGWCRPRIRSARGALNELVGTKKHVRNLGATARAPPPALAWDSIAGQTIDLYRELIAR